MSKIDGTYPIGDHKLTFNVNALCDLEDAFGVDDVNQVVEKINQLQDKPSLRTIRTIFHVGLKQNHPEMTEQKAGEVISEIGIDKAAEALGKAIERAFPQSEDSDQEGEDSGEPKQNPGTGEKS